ncbi:hypothetical protein HYDPIDRAFT_168417 [Hydnomerulius pinastri MD-312]|uniref:Uncharacterized protein n=1 Tax=Hydnomerulius pinastri MD-312 TaxID=994086 RepID=A0A0C9WE48_9AGAM|nr:hypothetical protein HYDPIDRAFT_168417 [Hydnomerulius pinastri MD-312]
MIVSVTARTRDGGGRHLVTPVLLEATMDGASSAATILQPIQIAGQVTATTYRYSVSVKDTEASRKCLLNEIALITDVTSYVKGILDNSSVYRKDTGNDNYQHLDALLCPWSTEDGPPSQCGSVNFLENAAKNLSQCLEEVRAMTRTAGTDEEVVSLVQHAEGISERAKGVALLNPADCTNKRELMYKQRQGDTPYERYQASAVGSAGQAYRNQPLVLNAERDLGD